MGSANAPVISKEDKMRFSEMHAGDGVLEGYWLPA